MEQNGEIALISLGSNPPDGQGAATSFVLYGRDRIARALGEGAVQVSRLYSTPAFPAGIGPNFVNATMAIAVRLSAEDVLATLHEIEAEAGRARVTRWGPRTLDLDLLALGGQVLPDRASQTRWRELAPEDQGKLWPDRLILPHPRLQDRAFVLVPLAEVAPDWTHPVTGLTVVAMRDALPQSDRDAVIPINA